MGSHCRGGAQLAVDTTLVSPLTSSSQPRRRAGQYTGAALQDARRSKERTYPELLRSRRCRLVVFALEIGGPVEPGSYLIPTLASPHKSQSSPGHPPQSRRSLPPFPLVRHPDPCSPARLRGQSPGLRLRRRQRDRWRRPIYQPASLRSTSPRQPSPSPPLRS